MAKQVAIVASAQALASSIFTISDAFLLGNRYVENIYNSIEQLPAFSHVRLLASEGRSVRLADGRELVSDGGLVQEHFDLVFLANVMGGETREEIGEWLEQERELVSWVAWQHKKGAIVAASGQSVLALCEAGLLDRKLATAPWWLGGLCRQRFPRVGFDTALTVAVEDRVITGAGANAELALAAKFIECLFSPNVADWFARRSRADTEVSQPSLLTSDLPSGEEDALVARAQHWLRERFSQRVLISELANAMAVSQKTLIRRFERSAGTTPHDYLQTLRIEASKRMLVRTSRDIARIAGLVGYNDVRFYKKLFRDRTGVSPAEFRRREQQDADNRYR